MANLFKQGHSQILIIGDQQADFYVWNKKQLSFVSQFNIDEEGYDQFAILLSQHTRHPLIIVADLIDEGFRNENIVHVSSTDRKALLERKLNYTFRTTPYRVARVTGREGRGRKDDNVLLSAITKPELLKPWIDVVQKQKIQLQSITSFAYLLEHFVQNSHLSKEPFLLITSLDESMKLRQTFFNNGKILFSRSITLSSKDPRSISNDVYQESLRIRRYLERIKALHFENPIKLVIYSHLQASDLEMNIKSSDMMFPEIFNINNEISNFSIELSGQAPDSIILYCASLLKSARIENTYAPFEDRKYYHLNMTGVCMAWSAVLFLILTLGIKIPTLFDALGKWDQQEQMKARTAPLEREYEQLTRRFPETPIPSKEMALVVETAEAIEKQIYTPSSLINLISTALQSSPELSLSRIHWELLEEEVEIDPQYGIAPIDLDPTDNYQSAIIEGRTKFITEINGLAFSTNSYREVQEQVLQFVNALEDIPGVTVNPVKMPIDVRVDASVTTTVGDSEVSAPFTLELTFEDLL